MPEKPISTAEHSHPERTHISARGQLPFLSLKCVVSMGCFWIMSRVPTGNDPDIAQDHASSQDQQRKSEINGSWRRFPTQFADDAGKERKRKASANGTGFKEDASTTSE